MELQTGKYYILSKTTVYVMISINLFMLALKKQVSGYNFGNLDGTLDNCKVTVLQVVTNGVNICIFIRQV